MFLRILNHLLPKARAFKLAYNSTIRKFFDGLGITLGSDVKDFFDNNFNDIDPQQTRELSNWEEQFALLNTGLTEQERRDRLSATWQALGGQSPRYIQDTLQAAGFDVYVHEWWEPGTNPPVARNPFTYLWDGAAPRQYIGVGNDLAYCGGDSMFCNSQNSLPGYPLVNKVLEAINSIIGVGSDQAYVGGNYAAAGTIITTYSKKQYIIPADSTKYPYFLYIGGATFPDVATIPLSRQDEFEDLCLKICPSEQWLGILVSYT